MLRLLLCSARCRTLRSPACIRKETARAHASQFRARSPDSARVTSSPFSKAHFLTRRPLFSRPVWLGRLLFYCDVSPRPPETARPQINPPPSTSKSARFFRVAFSTSLNIAIIEAYHLRQLRPHLIHWPHCLSGDNSRLRSPTIPHI